MKLIRNIQLVDLILQTILVGAVAIPLPFITITPGILFWSLMALLPLGGWQLLSAFILGFARSDNFRHLYLLTSVAFCGLFFAGGFLLDRLHLNDYNNSYPILSDLPQYLFCLLLVFSFIAALYYLGYSYRDYRAAQKTTFL